MFVPIENWLINCSIWLFPGRFRKKLEKAVERDLAYFTTQPSLIFDVIFQLRLIINDKYEPRLAELDDRVMQYFREVKDPHLRLFDHSYDPEIDGKDSIVEHDPDELDAVEIPMLKCLYADRTGLGEELIDELKALDDNGDYGTTHTLLGAVILKHFSSIRHEKLDALIESTIRPIVKKQRRSRIADIYSERTAFLQWLGYQQYIETAWIYRIIASQMADGGWYWHRSIFKKESHQHPTGLALAALIQYREIRLKNRKTELDLAQADIGNVLSLKDLRNIKPDEGHSG